MIDAWSIGNRKWERMKGERFALDTGSTRHLQPWLPEK
jgi:hypothetical protein